MFKLLSGCPVPERKLDSASMSLCPFLPTRLHSCAASPCSSAFSDGVGKEKQSAGKFTYTPYFILFATCFHRFGNSV